MTIHPKRLVLPAVMLCGLCISLLSIKANSSYVQPSPSQLINAANNQQAEALILSPEFPGSIQRWQRLIETTAADVGLDPNLIAAVILQESGGDPSAYSTSGAVGLMQVMPRDGIASTFMCGANPCFRSRPAIAELVDPQFNIQYGSNYLANLIREKGIKREALKSYGPMDVDFEYADIVLAIYENYR